jgi:hypothetical protein
MEKNKPIKSNRKNKKYMVLNDNNKIVHFGDKRYEQFKDNVGLYKKLNHNDKKRQKNYCKRSAFIRDKNGNLTKNNIDSANYWSRKLLWDC